MLVQWWLLNYDGLDRDRYLGGQKDTLNEAVLWLPVW